MKLKTWSKTPAGRTCCGLLHCVVLAASSAYLGWYLAEVYTRHELAKGPNGKYTCATSAACEAYINGYYDGVEDDRLHVSLDPFKRNEHWIPLNKD